MRQLVLVAVLAAFAVPAVAVAQSKSKKEPEFKEFVSEKLKYKVFFPGNPNQVTKNPSTKIGELTVNTVSLELKDVVYAVTATQYPDKLKDADAKLILLAAKDALSANGGKILSDETISIGGPDESKIEGREVAVEFGKTRIRTRLALVGPILYQVSVTGTEKALGGELPKKFLPAFEVTP